MTTTLPAAHWLRVTQAAGADTAASAAVASPGVAPAATPPLAVTSVALAKAYEENEAAADNAYKD